MRCIICDIALSDEESTKKFSPTSPLKDNFIDTCNSCLEIIREIERDYEESKKKRGNVTPLKHT